MVAQRDKEVKEQLRATMVHLQLHGAAALEGAAAADDQGKIVCSKLGVGVGGMGVGVPRGRQNGARLDARLCRRRSVFTI